MDEQKEEHKALVQETIKQIHVAALCQCHQNTAKGNLKQAEKALCLAERAAMLLSGG